MDEHGRGFIVHVERVSAGTPSFALTLHVFDVNDPSRFSIAYRIAPARYSSGLGAPCIAISSGPIETRFVIACLGKLSGTTRFESIHVASGTLSVPPAGRMTSPVLRVYNVLQLQPSYFELSEPSVFMDNDEQVHLVYTGQLGLPLPKVIVYNRAEWNGDPNSWRWGSRELDRLDYDMQNPSVAARWQGGELVVVAACKVVRPVGNGQVAGVYWNTATARGRIQRWRGWEFLAGEDVLAGTPSGPGDDNTAQDPSVWVAEDGPFCIGYDERDPDTSYFYPRVATHVAPERASSSWVTHDMGRTNYFDHFVCVSGDGERGICVWESRDGSLSDPATWAAGVAVLSDSTSPSWVLSNPSSNWGLNLNPIMGQDRLSFPTCFVTESTFFVAWLYVDRSQDGLTSGGPLDSPLTWPFAPAGAVVSIQLLVGVLS